MADQPESPPSKKRGKKKEKTGTEKAQKWQRALRELNIHKPLRAVSAADVANMNFLKNELRETWHTLWETANNYKRFTQKQIKFAKAYALNGRRLLVKSMKEAGYDYADDEQAAVRARHMLKMHHFEDLIRAFEFEEKARMKLTTDDVSEWFQRIATAAMETGDFTNANRALENLAKFLGMFVERKEIRHTVIHNKQELDTRIAELTQILKESESEIEAKLRIN